MSIDYTDPQVSPGFMVSAKGQFGKALFMQPYAAKAGAEAVAWRGRAAAAEAAIARVRELVEGHINVGADDVLRALTGEPTDTETEDEQQRAAG